MGLGQGNPASGGPVIAQYGTGYRVGFASRCDSGLADPCAVRYVGQLLQSGIARQTRPVRRQGYGNKRVIGDVEARLIGAVGLAPGIQRQSAAGII